LLSEGARAVILKRRMKSKKQVRLRVGKTGFLSGKKRK